MSLLRQKIADRSIQTFGYKRLVWKLVERVYQKQCDETQKKLRCYERKRAVCNMCHSMYKAGNLGYEDFRKADQEATEAFEAYWASSMEHYKEIERFWQIIAYINRSPNPPDWGNSPVIPQGESL